MKAIKCEMCDSTDVVKQGDFYVCQSCGTKYETEAARKLMVEVDGAVKIDHSAFVESSLANARRAKEKEDWEECEKYYNLVEQHEPSNIEAIFYSSYGKAMQSLVDADIYKREAAFKPLRNSISIVDDNFDVESVSDQMSIIRSISADLLIVSSSKFVNTTVKNGYGITVRDDKGATLAIFKSLHSEFCDTLTNIIDKLPVSEKDTIIELYELAAVHAKSSSRPETSKLYSDRAEELRDPAAYSERIKAEKEAADKAAAEAVERSAKNKKLLKVGVIAAVIAAVAIAAIAFGVNYASSSHYESPDAMKLAVQGTYSNSTSDDSMYSKLLISGSSAKILTSSGDEWLAYTITQFDNGAGTLSLTETAFAEVEHTSVSQRKITAKVTPDGAIELAPRDTKYVFVK